MIGATKSLIPTGLLESERALQAVSQRVCRQTKAGFTIDSLRVAFTVCELRAASYLGVEGIKEVSHRGRMGDRVKRPAVM